jgi:hypothetical protein
MLYPDPLVNHAVELVFEPAFEHSGCINSGRRAVSELSRFAYSNQK